MTDTSITLFQLIVAIITSAISSSGLFATIQFLISRNDKRKDEIGKLQSSFDEMHKEIKERDEKFKQTIDALASDIARRDVIQSRIRILRANDEMRQGIHHSYEYFRQLHQDITEYENYCMSHPEFKNNEAVNSIEYINRIYQSCLDNNSFLA